MSSPALGAAIQAVPYASSLKIVLEFNRRFWKRTSDLRRHQLHDQSITQISYPSHGYLDRGPAVLLGAYSFDLPSYQLSAMSPKERIDAALEQGAKIHNQYLRSSGRASRSPGAASLDAWMLRHVERGNHAGRTTRR